MSLLAIFTWIAKYIKEGEGKLLYSQNNKLRKTAILGMAHVL
jgi:hypothetical protein